MNDTYVPPILTVDSVIFELHDDSLSVLLIQRADEPFKGVWALPGGYNPQGETTQEAMARILERKAGLGMDQLTYVEQLYTFDTVARDPRGHAVSVTYMGLGRDISLNDVDTSQRPEFFNLDSLPQLAYDHNQIISYAHNRLRSKISYTNAIKGLLRSTFTLTRLQSAYEAVLGRELDKRNFRKKLLAQSIVAATGEYHREGAHRPAQLYAFTNHDIVYFTNDFD